MHKHAVSAALISSAILSTAQAQPDFPAKEAAQAAAIGALAGVELSSTIIAASSPEPITMFAADAAAYSAGLAVKYFEAPLIAPASISRMPNTDDDCFREFEINQYKAPFSNLYGLINIPTIVDIATDPNLSFSPVAIPEDWGELGKPDVYHASTDVLLIAENNFLTAAFREDRCTTAQKNNRSCYSGEVEVGLWEPDSVTVQFPAGNHVINWQAHSQIDILFDLGVNTILTASGMLAKYRSGELGAAIAGKQKKATKEAAKNSTSDVILDVLGIDSPGTCTSSGKALCVTALIGDSNSYVYGWSPFSVVTATREREQTFTVYDVHDPTLTILEPEITLEASDLGGTFLSRVREQIFASVEADDACDRPVGLANDLPNLLPIGRSTVTWTARDLGPAPDADFNSVTKTQTLVVQDTQPPIIVAPPGRVIEVSPQDNDNSDGKTAAGVDPSVVDLGQPLVVDLADPIPRVSSDAPEFFPVNTRTPVTWTATDQGFPMPNSASANQLITVKLAGTNTAPAVSNRSASTLTSQPVDIVLRGIDRDELGGRVDPLSFRITERPSSGEFIAPLLPYFIEDYRTSPGGPYGAEFYESGNRTRWMYDNVCRDPDLANVQPKIRRDWVYRPRFAQVTDDGLLYLIDTYWRCNPSDATGGGPRISKWTRDGEYLGQIDYPGTTDAFVLDQDGLIYTLTRQGSGSSTTLTLRQIRPNFDEVGTQAYGDLWKFDFDSAPGVPLSNNQFSYARVDSRRGLIYVNDRRRIFVYDVRDDINNNEDDSRNGMRDLFVGALKGGEEVFGCNSFGSSWTGFAMEVDSEGNLYAADSCADRIHKFGPPTFDEEGNVVLGAYIGWLGRCDSTSNKACDVENEVTRGYSCTDRTCGASTTQGDEAGQLSAPVYLAADPNDILYVADTANDRIQRFAPDGSFAGVAESTGTGINRGSRPSFILGNIASPKAVTVNSTQFFVVDQEESFIHVFETSPLKDVTDSTATVSYVSRFDFHSDTDTFRYRASDGLAESNEGTVTVQVSRNFRPPVADPLVLDTDEDTDVDITLTGDDPDGILGRDFNGLDTLTFKVVDEPLNGELSGEPPELVYTPNENFFGTDQFTYAADDGRDESVPALVQITVRPVDDPVSLAGFKPPERIGAGFPAVFMGEFDDDGTESPYEVTIAWDDGSTDETGGFVDPDGEGEEPARLEGVSVTAPPSTGGTGMYVANHSYAQPGQYGIFYCVDDGKAEDCATQTVRVERLVNIAMGFTQDLVETTDPQVTLDLMIMNAEPETGPGLAADGLRLTAFDLDAVDIRAIRVLEGAANCRIGNNFLCTVDSLAAGGNLHFQLDVAPTAGSLFAAIEGAIGLRLTTTSESVQRRYLATRNLSFDVDSGDEDGDGISNQYERFYGLNPAFAADAAGDLDGDGLSNRAEFDLRTDPTRADTDGDGAPDASDPDPLDPDVGPDVRRGDFNGDNRIDAADILLLQRALRGDAAAVNQNPDLNGDNTLDAADVLRLQQEVQQQ